MKEQKITGYPSIDKPWMKYYSPEAINAPMPTNSMYEYIYEMNRQHMNDTALIYFENRIKYKTLFNNIDYAAKAFQRIGIHKGDVVSILSITTPEMIYALYGLNKISVVINMLDPRASANTLAMQITKTHSNTVIVLDTCLEKLNDVCSIINIDNIILISVSESMSIPVKLASRAKTFLQNKDSMKHCKEKIIKWDDFLRMDAVYSSTSEESKGELSALIMYTGGTTGKPKGVLLSNQNVNSIAEQYKNAVDSLRRQDTWLSVSAPFIAYALIIGLHLPLSYGMQCCIELYDPEIIAKKVIVKKYNHVAVTPIIWEKVIQSSLAKEADLSYLIAPASGADSISLALESRINAFFAEHGCEWNLCQGYGMTELGSGVTGILTKNCNKLGSVGVPFGNTVISTFDPETEEEKRIGEIGEVCVKGPSVMKSYYSDLQATNEIIHLHKDGTRWLHTGDLGHLDEDGFLYIDGRIKRMITRADGFKVFPSVIEEKLIQHPYIKKCVVVGAKDTDSEVGQLPVAFVVLSNACNIKTDELKKQLEEYCRNHLPQYAWPIEYGVCESFPLTPAGKIDYRALERKADSI